ncbi:MAG: cytidine deaminase [Ginsengibacter sp.]|jgi:cytidine deaminase
MKIEEIKINVKVYDSIEDMEKEDANLLKQARLVTQNAYAPYSNFLVGAYAKLVNGEIVTGTNQENASYPAGICAERTLMSVAATLFPGVGMDTIAISYHNLNGKSDQPAGPCGICRQSFAEFQARTGHPIRVILGGMEGRVLILDNISDLLPLSFGEGDMK